MKVFDWLLLIGIILFVTSCGFMFPEELSFDESRVPGEYQGEITCSYTPCSYLGSTTFIITEGESYFTLSVADSDSSELPPLDFQIKLDGEKIGEAKTVSGFIQFAEGQDWKLTPYNQHTFSYWTYYDTQQEGEQFEMRIYNSETEDASQPQDIDYLELVGYKRVQ